MAEKKLKILFQTARFPFPVIGGDRVKPYNIIKYLAHKHELTLISFYQGAKIKDEYIDEIKKLGADVRVIPLNPVTAGLRAGIKTIGSFPLEIGFYHNPLFRKTVNQLHKEKQFDLGFAFFMRTAEYIKNYNFKKILMAEDCRTLYQKRSFEESSALKQKIIRGWEYWRLKKYEPDIVDSFDITTLVTNEDIEAMKKQNPRAKYRLLTNGTDIDFFLPPPDGHKREGVLFAGKLDVWANVLMIENIVKNILPKIRAEIPGVKLNIVGANPPKAIASLISDDVVLHSNVPSMVPYLQNAELFIHPHLGGSGIQNKLLEAMACACPVVTSQTGTQGIPATHNENVMIGKDYNEMAAHTIKILKDKDFARRIGANAREMIVRTHSWQSIFKDLDGIIKELFY